MELLQSIWSLITNPFIVMVILVNLICNVLRKACRK